MNNKSTANTCKHKQSALSSCPVNSLKKLSILAAFFALLTSCDSSGSSDKKYYAENTPAYFDLRNGSLLKNNWIRKPENLLTIHETFKKVGYNNLLGRLLFDKPVVIQDLYINKNGHDLIDSLVLTYQQRNKGTEYYKEFWARREKEKNDSTVFAILRDIKFSFKSKLGSAALGLNADSSKVNDTLRQLLEIEFRYDSLTNEIAIQDFETLRHLGFHQSAYTLLFESYRYQDIKWNRDSLAKTLNQTDKYIAPWFQDEIK